MKIDACLSSQSNEWATPQGLFDALNAEFGFTLDPCCTHQNAKCAKHYTASDNGLIHSWRGEVVFMNPPYGREIGLWVAKAFREAQGGATVVCLIPARTDTAYWHDYCVHGEVRFIRGRVKFVREGAVNSAPFPSAIVIFRNALRTTGEAK